MKKIVLIIFLLSLNLGYSQENSSPKKRTQKGFGSLDFISVKMPNDQFNNPEDNMGLTGVHYNLWLNKSFYTGLGFYGSVTGKRGGLFTLGVNAGIKTDLTNNLFLDTGFHFGGGGGASAPDGGGAFILPHINLGYQFKNFSTTLGYSYINFFDKGNITSHQLRLGIQVPLSFDYTNFKNKERVFTSEKLKKTAWNQEAKRISLMMHLNNLKPYGESKFTDGSSLVDKNIRLAGFEIDAYISDQFFTFFKVDGAFDGIRGGYMDIFIGSGYHLALNKNRTNILAKFGIGAGGGGGADTGGGFLIYPDISIEQKLFNNIYLSVNKGYLMNPNQHFTTSTFGVGIKYYANHQGIKTNKEKIINSIKIKGFELIIGHEMYSNVQRIIEPIENLHQIALQINLYTSSKFYLAGHTSFANFGNAGAYAEGLIGIGYQTNSFYKNKFQLFTQILAGAAGGGDISTGQGLIIKPSLGLNLKLNEKLNLRTSIGKVKARKGSLNSTSFTFGLNYRVGFLTSK
jgi:hypothetical protein